MAVNAKTDVQANVSAMTSAFAGRTFTLDSNDKLFEQAATGDPVHYTGFEAALGDHAKAHAIAQMLSEIQHKAPIKIH